LRRRLELMGGASRCALHQRMCHAHFYRASLGPGEEEEEEEEESVAAAVEAGRRCARELWRSRCEKEFDELAQAVRF
jgi:hypothetical protein